MALFRCKGIDRDYSEYYGTGFRHLCEETVRATFLRFHPLISNKDLHSMLKDKVSFGRWTNAMEGLSFNDLEMLCVELILDRTKPDSSGTLVPFLLSSLLYYSLAEYMQLVVKMSLPQDFRNFVNALRTLDDQLFKVASQLQMLSLEQLQLCRYLEVERIQTTYNAAITRYIQSKHSLKTSVLFCMSDIEKELFSHRICQRASNLSNLECLIFNRLDTGSFPVPLSFYNEECSSIIEFLIEPALYW